ncbi:FecR domain-containing protein [Flavisphingomonas formosensis]|uniref:FecR domain-containing protein n=1 Tax=Flavisphingomonas formosensis TaxID=861534 RepID=UPI0012FB3C43|nr:FecR domain-containing protein [Sphingomonas formosensis]
MTRILLASLLLASAAPAIARDTARPQMVDYVVRKGDTLYTLADRYLQRQSDHMMVGRINRIADPYRLPTGKVLHIPRALLREEAVSARIEAFSGPVRIEAGGRSGAPLVGMLATETSRIVTGANAFVTLRLADGSTVSIPSQSRVTIGRMRKVILTGSIERRFEVEAGRVRTAVTPMKSDDSSFHVVTPVAVAAVRGTEFQIGYDSDRQAETAEVLQGKVAVGTAATGSSVLVPAGFGTVTTPAGAATPVKLLPAPALDNPGRVQNDRELSFAIKLAADATGYHVEVAHDGDLLDRIAEVRSPTPAATLPSIPAGTYFVRISAIDANGLEGLPAIYGFERRLNRVEGSMETSRSRHMRRYQFRWYSEGDGAKQYRFQLSTQPDGSAPIIDEAGLAATQIAVTNLPGGDYYWRVMSVQFADGKAYGAWMPLHHFHIATR